MGSYKDEHQKVLTKKKKKKREGFGLTCLSLIKQNNIQSKTGKYTIEYREECTLIQKGI